MASLRTGLEKRVGLREISWGEWVVARLVRLQDMRLQLLCILANTDIRSLACPVFASAYAHEIGP